MDVDIFKTQNRQGIGVAGVSYKLKNIGQIISKEVGQLEIQTLNQQADGQNIQHGMMVDHDTDPEKHKA